MASIRIKNIGPLSDTGTIPLTHIMLILGEQSSGKSTFMKILCFCRWAEKKVMIGEEDEIIDDGWDFIEQLKAFHKLSDEYFSDSSAIEFEGDAVSIVLQHGRTTISKHSDFLQVRHNTKLSYIPAERNLLSVIPNLDDKYRSSTFDAMFNAAIEFNEANKIFSKNSPLALSIAGDMAYYREGRNDYVSLSQNGKILLLEHTSSGIQAALPLSVMVHYLCHITGEASRRTPKMVMKDDTLRFDETNKDKRINYYNYPQLFIEEPEQHLYPTSQALVVRDIMTQFSYAKQKTGIAGFLFITTHSPYILTQFNILLKAQKAFQKNENATIGLIPKVCILPLDFYSAYYVDANGQMRNMIDSDTHLVMGEYLDSVSDEVEDTMNALNEIIYG
ncbi:MAG: ATP-binding protein [Bacteroidales bacterium]|nr:ATP-binding protein [Bacteroidales bacterium]